MAHSARTRLLAFVLVLVAVGGLIIASFFGPDRSNGIIVTMQGSGVVGTNVRFLVTAQGSPYPRWQGFRLGGAALSETHLVYLSLEGLDRIFEISGTGTQDNPWGRVNIWNLTGLDLSWGRTFALDAMPVWAAEFSLSAVVWSPSSELANVQFINGDMVDPSTVFTEYRVQADMSTKWPLTASVTPDAPLILGQTTSMHISVRDWTSGPSPSAPLFLSVVTKPMYYTLATDGLDENPWNMTACWNLTGADLYRGFEVVVSATPTMAAKGVPLDVVVWSPRGSTSAVQVGSDGYLVKNEAIRLWVDTTFSFSVAGA